jgi:predicted RNase H-like HicB family nuclease
MKEQLTAVFQQVPEGYIGFVEELPGANTQGDTLGEARTNLQEAVQLVLESNRALAEESLRNKTVIREPLASISWNGSMWSATGNITVSSFSVKAGVTRCMWTALSAKRRPFPAIEKSTTSSLRRFAKI